MPPGWQKSARSSWPRHEGAYRYEPLSRLDQPALQRGIEATHWSLLGAANASDFEIMSYAQINGYTVLTHDLDFSAILAATNGGKPSVVQIRAEDVTPSAIGKQVIAAFIQAAPELEEGALLTVDPRRMRLRLLPLSSGN